MAKRRLMMSRSSYDEVGDIEASVVTKRNRFEFISAGSIISSAASRSA